MVSGASNSEIASGTFKDFKVVLQVVAVALDRDQLDARGLCEARLRFTSTFALP